MIPYMGSDGGACYQDGLLPWQWGQRMKDAGAKFSFIREEQSTAEQVNLRYLNFANGNVYDTPISKATSAKAGVMTAADKTKLDNLTAYACDLGNFESEQAALNALKDVEISGNSNIVHVHCTYDNGAMSITMMQSIKNDYCRQVIFNKSKVFQRAIHLLIALDKKSVMQKIGVVFSVIDYNGIEERINMYYANSICHLIKNIQTLYPPQLQTMMA